MIKLNYKNPAVLTAREARKQGVQISDTPEMAMGIRTIMTDKVEVKKVRVMPADFVVDRFNFEILDISHFGYNNKKVH
jgi:hypothetical protein